MGRYVRPALVAVLCAAVAGCGGGEKDPGLIEKVGEVPVAAADNQAVQLYLRPYGWDNDPGTKGDVIRAGSNIVAKCFALNGTEAMSSIGVKSGRIHGYANIYRLKSQKEPVRLPVFDVPIEQLKETLPECTSSNASSGPVYSSDR